VDFNTSPGSNSPHEAQNGSPAPNRGQQPEWFRSKLSEFGKRVMQPMPAQGGRILKF
jgi:hypothetical protein